MNPVEVIQGDGPVVLGLPHTGTWLPEAIAERLNDNGHMLADTDWHIDRLYSDLLPGATMVRATFHRYVIDANRDPEGHSLYPGQNTTALVPFTDFDGRDIWDEPPTDAEITGRLDAFHRPYHAALEAEMTRIAARHGFAILYDCHSIRTKIPFLFGGLLPVFNVGTADGTTCAPALQELVVDHVARADGPHVLNGRFKGGWTTRHYGQPDKGWHAIQMELAQRAYLTAEAPPWSYDETRAVALRAVLGPLLADLAEWRPQ